MINVSVLISLEPLIRETEEMSEMRIFLDGVSASDSDCHLLKPATSSIASNMQVPTKVEDENEKWTK